jgi:hypothetical protein
MTTALRPLSTGELLDRTFFLYRNHFALFVGIFALPQLLILGLQLLVVAFRGPGTPIVGGLALLVTGLGQLVVSAAAQAATIVAVSHVHLDRPTGVMDSFSRVKGQILGVVLLSLAVGFAVALGFIFLIVPGILLMLRWSLAVPAKVLEDRGVGDAMSRSSELTQGNRGRIFVIWILFIVLDIGVALLMQWPIQLGAGVTGAAGLQHAPLGWQVASNVATFISSCLVGPLGTIAFSLVYYDERVRKEAFDLQLMMSTLDAAALQGAPAQAGA